MRKRNVGRTPMVIIILNILFIAIYFINNSSGTTTFHETKVITDTLELSTEDSLQEKGE